MSKKERRTTDSRASEQGLNSKPPPPGLFDSLSLLTWTKPSRTVLSNEKSGTRAGRKPCSDGATRRSASIECGVDVADDGDADERLLRRRPSRSAASRSRHFSAFRSTTKMTTGTTAASSETRKTSAMEAMADVIFLALEG